MLRCLLTLVALLLPLSASAQPLVPFQPDREPLAGASEVPTAFLLGLGGPTPYFVNPARATHARDPFVYGTANGFDAEAGPVALAALLGSGDSRWLVSAENLTRSTNRSTDNILTRQDMPSSGWVRTIEDETVTADTRADVSTRARVAFVGESGFGSFALGLFGGYRTNVWTRDDDRELLVTEQVEQGASVFDRINEDREDRTAENDRDAFGIGAEFGLAGRGWDLAGSLSYQRTHDHSEFTSSSFEQLTVDERFGDGRFLSRLDRRQTDQQQTFGDDLSGVAFETIGTLRTSRDRDDYLYGAASGVYATGTSEIALDTRSEVLVRIDDNGSMYEDLQVAEAENAADLDIQSSTTSVSLGYVFARRKRGFIVLAGAIPSGRLQRFTVFGGGGIGDDAVFIDQLDGDELRLGIELPLHLRVPLSRSLSLFGGAAYSYVYSESTVERRPAPGSDIPADAERVQTSTSEAFTSNNRLYGGALLNLRSGFAAQAAFRGSLAEFEGWTVSLGYHF